MRAAIVALSLTATGAVALAQGQVAATEGAPDDDPTQRGAGPRGAGSQGAVRRGPVRPDLVSTEPAALDPAERDPAQLDPLERDPVQPTPAHLGPARLDSVPRDPTQQRPSAKDPAQEAAARRHFEEGLRHYEAEAFKAARSAFEQALALSPVNADYNHWLGKAYGRLAERANPFSAIAFATRALERFEQAVALDGENRPALVSLMEYYQEAPGLLGGSKRKAAEIRARIAALDAVRPPAPTRDIEPD